MVTAILSGMNQPPLIPGKFVRRDNRFRATVLVNGRIAAAHVPNSGRLGELLTPGRPVWLRTAGSGTRKTAFDLKLVALGDVLVSVDARLPNPLFAAAVRAGLLPQFPYTQIQGEVTYGDSRLDFRLGDGEDACWVETKSVTLVENSTARFPDAPTERGRRHLQTLITLRQQGYRAAVVFVIQRPDATAFAPHETADPAFADALRAAAAAGVEVHAYICDVSTTCISLKTAVAVQLSA